MDEGDSKNNQQAEKQGKQNNVIQRYENYSVLPNLFNDFVSQIYSPKNNPAIQYKTKFAFHKLPVSSSREY